jgi:mRNA interferase MazF
MKHGEIWWSDVPGWGRRPVVVLTRDAAITLLRRVVVAMVTTTIRNIPTEVVLERADGMSRRSAVNLDNLYTIDKTHLTSRITRLSEARLEEMCDAIRFAVAC